MDSWFKNVRDFKNIFNFHGSGCYQSTRCDKSHNGKADDTLYMGHDQLKEMTDAISELSAVIFEDFYVLK